MIAFKLRWPSRGSLFSEEQWLMIADRLELSRRELQIVKLVFEDAQERYIAGQLGVSVNTIHTQLKRLYNKLGATSRVGLVLEIVRESLTSAHVDPHFEPSVGLQSAARKAA